MESQDPLMPVSIKIESSLVEGIDRISRRELRSRTATVKLALIAFMKADDLKTDKPRERRGKHSTAK